ncbi:MAG: L-2-hydroxyglutarate oxidase [Acidimicrobiia bacterium]|nr:L-2-hydroxyglutarate oxidase [Acidimicrobiia bacterium]
MNDERVFDVCVVGAGLIGLSVALALSRSMSGIRIVVVDKEDGVARHQSSHNSGVVHSGLYYRPGSLKSRLCAEGRREIYEMCAEYGVPASRTGKLVIATRESELSALSELERRGRAAGLTGLERIGPAEIREREPHATGIAALQVPEAGVADFPGLAREMSAVLQTEGVDVRTAWSLSSITHGPSRIVATNGDDAIEASVLVNCAGLHSDRVAAMAGVDSDVKIVPFRGEYYRLKDDAARLVNALIYPVPDPRFPFLGVHFTRRVDGSVEVGPNAVLALAREQYRNVRPNVHDMGEVIASRGFRRLALRHGVSGVSELVRSRSKRLYARQARRLVPAITHDSLIQGGVGVRAQAIARDGALVDDFVIERAGGTIHVLNAPSPGATASIAIGRHVARMAREML